MKEQRQNSGVTFYPGSKNGLRIKILFATEGFVLLVCGYALAYQIVDFFPEQLVAFFLLLPIDLLFIVGGARFVIKIFDDEEITISSDALTIRERKWLIKKSNVYSLQDVHDVCYTGYAKKTDHPLKGNSYDYFGFETREKEISRLHDEGHVNFQYNNKTVRFGSNLCTWDAQRISDVMSEFTNGKLFIQNLPEEIPEEIYKGTLPPSV
jgi:hypothetical protein